MGHDVHFLQRIDRLRSEHAEFALGLYRDHEFVRYLLSKLALPEHEQRVAIALADGGRGPFVIVTREGRFVTCLGENMRLRGDETLVARHRLDALSQHVAALKQLIEDSRTGKDHQTRSLLTRILDAGPTLSREEFNACARWTPIAVHVFVECLLTLNRTTRRLYERLRRVKSPSQRHADAFTDFYRQSWAVGHLTLLLGSDHGTALEQLVSDVAPEAERPSVVWALIWCGMRQGTLSAVARSVWLASKLPKLLAGKLRQDYESTRLLSILLRCGMSLTTLALRHQRLRVQISKTLHRCELLGERPDSELGFRRLLAKTHERVVEQREELRERIGDDALLVLEGLEEQAKAHFGPTPDALKRDLAVPLLFAASDPLVGPDMVAPVLYEWLPWIAGAAASDFCIAEAYGSGHADIADPAHGYHLLRAREALEENHRVPAVAEERPSRNAPCSCGSGKKYKRCCG
jgi:hypothetical protein